MTQYKNPNYWFLLICVIIMTAIAIASYFIPNKIPFATEGIGIKLYRINYAVLAIMALLSNSLNVVRGYLIVTGWVMVFLVVSNWLHLTPETIFQFTKQDNFLHSNLGVISIFIGVIYGKSTASK